MQHARIRQSRMMVKRKNKNFASYPRFYIYSSMISSFPAWKWSMASENVIEGIPMVAYRRRSKWRESQVAISISLRIKANEYWRVDREIRADFLLFTFYFLFLLYKYASKFKLWSILSVVSFKSYKIFVKKSNMKWINYDRLIPYGWLTTFYISVIIRAYKLYASELKFSNHLALIRKGIAMINVSI